MFDPPYDAGTWIPHLQLFVEFCRVIAWPSAVFFAVYLFREQIRTLLHNLRELSPTKVAFHSPHQRKSSINSGDIVEPSWQHPDIKADPFKSEMRESILRDLDGYNDDQHKELLLFGLIHRILEREFFRAYIDIFGGQIRLLETINDESMDMDEVDEFLKSVKKEYPPLEDWTSSEYLEFLYSWKFVEGEEVVEITLLGRNFLQFVLGFRLNKAKPF
ncbi:hypothetical protein ACS3SW_07010 [Roseobacteraceae bacterium S113]